MAPDRMSSSAARHYQASERLANERTHLAYVRTAVLLIALGVVANRFSLVLLENGRLDRPRRSLAILGGTRHAGLGMVVYGLILLGAALYRYHRIEQAIDGFEHRPNRVMVTAVTVVALVGGALSMLWMFLA